MNQELTTEEKATLFDWMDSNGLLNCSIRAHEVKTKRQKDKVRYVETTHVIQWEEEYWCDYSETKYINTSADDPLFKLLQKAGFK